MNVKLSRSFKIMASNAIFAILLFFLVYLLLLLSAVVITIVFVIGGFAIIAFKPMWITIALGLGMASVGLFIFIFLIKFLFKQHKVDRSHLIEITKSDEPQLFKFIADIVKEVDTDFPKKVYLSSDVNACVFYDSSFWSMFFPIRKNLQIGIGLVNSITEQEFKAILAHEFGHFSQRTMKVGSYVYNLNQVIYNMLYDNESFEKMIQNWSNLSGYFSIFVVIAVKIIEGIQLILKQLYEIINVSYMALSREMEFHADEIAANIAGYLPLKESLLRMDLADHAYNSTLNFYDNKISDNLKSGNIFKEQEFVMNFLAHEDNLPYKNNLPLVSISDLRKYNRSKLTIKDQWASHPSVEERIGALEALNITKETYANSPAKALFANPEKTEIALTKKLYSFVNFTDNASDLFFDIFKEEYLDSFHKNVFPKLYNGYYDNKNPVPFDLEQSLTFDKAESMENLFGKEKLELVLQLNSLESDRDILNQIANKQFKVDSFDYDGHKYRSNGAESLRNNLAKEIEDLKNKLKLHDVEIYCFFYQKALENGNGQELKQKYLDLFNEDKSYDRKMEIYNMLQMATRFINVETPFDQIIKNFKKVYDLEIAFKEDIRTLLANKSVVGEITPSMQDNFNNYLSKDWHYFYNDEYYNDVLQILFTAMNNYQYLLSRNYFLLKLDLLKYQIEQL